MTLIKRSLLDCKSVSSLLAKILRCGELLETSAELNNIVAASYGHVYNSPLVVLVSYYVVQLRVHRML